MSPPTYRYRMLTTDPLTGVSPAVTKKNDPSHAVIEMERTHVRTLDDGRTDVLSVGQRYTVPSEVAKALTEPAPADPDAPADAPKPTAAAKLVEWIAEPTPAADPEVQPDTPAASPDA